MGKMGLFLRKSRSRANESLQLAMTGARLGERVLQVGVARRDLLAQLAGRVGLSGHAAAIVDGDAEAARAGAGAAAAGVLIDVRTTREDRFPFDDGAFDLTVIDATGNVLAGRTPEARARLTAETRRVLRAGGRIVVIEPGTPTGLRALVGGVRDHGEAGDRTVALLGAAGFRPVRELADREGLRFIEGLNSPQ